MLVVVVTVAMVAEAVEVVVGVVAEEGVMALAIM